MPSRDKVVIYIRKARTYCFAFPIMFLKVDEEL
ncbi:Uncharacterised protein [[Clostridium] sordellii]|nr:Uncharacterised protein [[Clostridium] sordellii] [Paeniclostridium sordellii]CEQ06231.1 Uncharacterised protein [[Clostridium] sordellii] [Paeniclostridium sordellii]CEQ17615.1 Uncharacterised protein [[Clostridium] sordellii] [Paeniclostridium sordellii]